MTKKLNWEAAERLLSDTAPEKSFFVFNGPVLKNVDELYHALSEMSDEQFSYHRNNNGKNDFYAWVIDVIGDMRLANEIGRSKTRQTTIKRVKKRIDLLKGVQGKK
ncbi:MAG: hypothetical protein KAK00_02995 [Nanoarchaeota archaeon]|nr:hypothetical protein [Nanoarchaeota archaeon]